MRASTQKWIALAISAIGIALLVYMITVEDEPGALPLALTLGGIIWFFVARGRSAQPRR